jgi:hypothetical protein
MNNFKNAVIAILTGLLALSLFTQPAIGAPAKATSPAVLIQYKHCLDLMSDKTNFYDGTPSFRLQFNRFVSSVVLSCVTYKPVILKDAKSLQYAACLALGNGLRQELGVQGDPWQGDGWDVAGSVAAIPYIQEACKTYRP